MKDKAPVSAADGGQHTGVTGGVHVHGQVITIAVLVAATEPRTRLRPVVPAMREYVLRIVHESMGMLVIDLAAAAAVVASALRTTGLARNCTSITAWRRQSAA